MTVATRTRQRADSGAYPVPWEQHVGTGCACDTVAPCLLHFADLDWQGRAQAWDRAGVTPPTRR